MQHCYRWLLPQKKNKRERERKENQHKRTQTFFSHNKVLRRNREAMEFNLDIESQMKESNQILTNEKHSNRVGSNLHKGP